MGRFAAILLGGAALLCTGGAWAADLAVGVSWNNFQEERWKTDEAAMKQVFDADGVKYLSADAQSSSSQQAADIEAVV